MSDSSWVTDELMDQMVEDGFMEHVGFDEEGKKLYRLTELGSASAENYVHNTPEGADLWARLEATKRD